MAVVDYGLRQVLTRKSSNSPIGVICTSPAFYPPRSGLTNHPVNPVNPVKYIFLFEKSLDRINRMNRIVEGYVYAGVIFHEAVLLKYKMGGDI